MLILDVITELKPIIVYIISWFIFSVIIGGIYAIFILMPKINKQLKLDDYGDSVDDNTYYEVMSIVHDKISDSYILSIRDICQSIYAPYEQIVIKYNYFKVGKIISSDEIREANLNNKNN